MPRQYICPSCSGAIHEPDCCDICGWMEIDPETDTYGGDLG